MGAALKKPGPRNMSDDRASSVIGYRLPFTLGHCGVQYPIYMTRNRLILSCSDCRHAAAGHCGKGGGFDSRRLHL